MIALLLLPLAARAGTYSAPVYTGGTATVPWFTHRPPNPYAQGTSTVNGTSYSGYGGDASGATSQAAACSGKITVTVTWQPAQGQTSTTDPPPDYVIVKETSLASAFGMCMPVAPVDGSCDNGIGVSQSSLTQTPAISPGPPPSTYGTQGTGFCYSVRYQALAGKAVMTFSPTPSASVSASASDPEPSGSVRYSVSVTPDYLNLDGTKLDPNKKDNILVGQGCGANITGLPSDNSTGWTDAFVWNVSGITFQGWYPNYNTSVTPPTSSAALPVMGFGTPSSSSIHWYWNDPDDGSGSSPPTSETVSCAVTLTPPAGQGNTFTVNVTKTVLVQSPAWTAGAHGGYMQVNTLASGNYELWAGPTAADAKAGLGAGMIWQAIVTTPTTPAFGVGKLQLIQIVKISDSYSSLPVPTTLTTTAQSYTDPLNGVQGLDKTYPYGSVYTEAPNTRFSENDSPDASLFGGGKAGTDVVVSAKFASSFTDTLMYMPPDSGNGTSWVPRATFAWSTDGSATIPTIGNIGTTNPPVTKDWSQYVAPAGSPYPDWAGKITPSGDTSLTSGNTFPTWTTLVITKHYPAP